MRKLQFLIITVTLLNAFSLSGKNVNSAFTITNTTDSILIVGKKIPEFTLDHIINFSQKSASQKNFEGKWLIIEFWATYCQPCVAHMMDIQKVQDSLKDKIQIMLISEEDEKTVKSFLRNMEQRKRKITLPTAINSPLVRTLNVPSLGYCVIVNDKGVISEISSSEKITVANIEAVMANKKTNISVKLDDKRPFNYAKPLLINGNGGNEDRLLYHSTISRYLPGIGSVVSTRRVDSINHTIGLICTNFSIWDLYKTAYSDRFNLNSLEVPANRTILDVQDTTKYRFTGKGVDAWNAWKEDNLYGYNVVLPLSRMNELKDIMKRDLNSFFDIAPSIEKRKIKCLVLTKITNEDKIHSIGLTPQYEENFYWIKMKNMPLSTLIFHLTFKWFQLLPMPVLDETNYSGNVDIEINAKMSNVEEVRKELNKYGLDLEEQERTVDMLVLRKK